MSQHLTYVNKIKINGIVFSVCTLIQTGHIKIMNWPVFAKPSTNIIQLVTSASWCFVINNRNMVAVRNCTVEKTLVTINVGAWTFVW